MPNIVMVGHVLTKVIFGQAKESLLDTHEQKSRLIGLHVVALTNRMTVSQRLKPLGPINPKYFAPPAESYTL